LEAGSKRLRTDWNIDGHDSLTVQGDIYDGLSGEAVRIATLSPPGAAVVDKNAELSGGNLLTRWQRTLKGGSDIQLQVYYDRVNRLQANQAEYRNTFDVDFVHHIKLNKRQDFIWGLEARLSPAKLPEIIPTYVFTPDRRVDQVYTAYAQDDFRWSRTSSRLQPGPSYCTAASPDSMLSPAGGCSGHCAAAYLLGRCHARGEDTFGHRRYARKHVTRNYQPPCILSYER